MFPRKQSSISLRSKVGYTRLTRTLHRSSVNGRATQGHGLQIVVLSMLLLLFPQQVILFQPYLNDVADHVVSTGRHSIPEPASLFPGRLIDTFTAELKKPEWNSIKLIYAIDLTGKDPSFTLKGLQANSPEETGIHFTWADVPPSRAPPA